MLPHHRHVPMGWAGWAIVAVLLVGVPAACHGTIARERPEAGVRLAPPMCRNLADMVAKAAAARDQGVRHRQFVDAVSRAFDGAGPRVAEITRRIVYRELRRVFASAAAPAELELDTFTRCMTGPMGEERA